MSKVIKQMQMAALKQTFQGVRDMVVLSIQGMSSQGEYTFRAALRKKKVRVQVVKNSLTRKVLGELGISVGADSPYWEKPTALAWGATSISQLSREIESELKHPKNGPLYKSKEGKPFVAIKGAIADGQPVSFEDALKMPTREEAIARVVSLALSPAARLVSQITGPASQVAGQIKSLAEKKPGEGAPAGGAAAAAT
jgi:large subunit ribosomal protein L10